MDTGRSIWEDRRISATCKNRHENLKFCLCTDEGLLGWCCPRTAQFSLSSPARRQLVLPSSPAQHCGCLHIAFQGGFSLHQSISSICLPSHSAAPGTFALIYFTPEHFRRLVGLASASALAGAQPLPGSKRVSGH